MSPLSTAALAYVSTVAALLILAGIVCGAAKAWRCAVKAMRRRRLWRKVGKRYGVRWLRLRTSKSISAAVSRAWEERHNG